MRPQPLGEGVGPDAQLPRGLDARPRMRLIAIVLWSAFMGATCFLVAWFALMSEFWMSGLDLAHLSRVFFIAWALALVPAGAAALLASPSGHDGQTHGH